MNQTSWVELSKRVPLGTRVKGYTTIKFRSGDNYTWCNADGKEGIVIRHYRETFGYRGEAQLSLGMVCQLEHEMEERSVPPRLVKYFIGGKWLTFDEVMK